jgi:outer membrane protein assembly factor BamB
MVAMDLRSGTQIWDQQIGGIETPWIAGDYLFVLSNDGEIVCLRRTDGRIRWATPLARWLDPEKRQDIIVWMGPVLLSDRLVVVSSRGVALSVSPYTGEPLGQITLPDGVAVAPVVANGAMYLLTQDAELLAFR